MNDLQEYKSLLAEMESGDSYLKTNPFSGALGKYQFIPSTLNALQWIYNLPAWVSPLNFLSNSSLQENYINAQIEDTLIFLERSGLKNFVGSSVRGSKRFPNSRTSITIYGLLAGAHLAGTGNLKKYLEQGINVDDGTTSISDYIYYFSDKLNGSMATLYGMALAFLLFYLLY